MIKPPDGNKPIRRKFYAISCLLCLLLMTTSEIIIMAAANRSCMPMEIHELRLNEEPL